MNDAGAVTGSWTFGPGIDQPLAINRGGVMHYYLADGLGSVRALTDEAGAVAQTYEYSVFGEITKDSGNVENPFTYTAREWEPEVGLYYYRARFYDAGVGRFLSEDRMQFASRDWNFYRYVANNPTSFVDPSGMFQFYGNWGGPDWSGGQTKPLETLSQDEVSKLPGPIDEMDAKFKEHDFCWSNARVERDKLLKTPCATESEKNAALMVYRNEISKCDKTLAQQLKGLDDDPNKWAPPAPDVNLARKQRWLAMRWFF